MVEGESTKEFCTRLSQDAADCEWEKMTNQDAIKITVCLRNKIDKLRDEILVNDISYDNMITKATSLEQAQAEKEFIRNTTASEEPITEEGINRVYKVDSGQYSRQRQRQQTMLAGKPASTHKTDICGRCNRRLPYMQGDWPAKGKRCDHCGILGHFRVCCRKREQKVQKESTSSMVQTVEDLNYDFGQVELQMDQVTEVHKNPSGQYPSTMVKVLVNEQ